MKPIERSAHIARTADGLTHTNRLSVPEFGVVELRVLQGGVSSKSHRLPRSKTPRDPAVVGDDNFHFAPGPQLDPGPWTVDAARHDRVVILYNLYNPFGAVKKARLELFVRKEKKPVWQRELTGKELFDGEHRLECHYDTGAPQLQRGPEWDGGLRAAADGKLHKDSRFPDGFLTTEHSPYKLRLLTEGDAMCRAPVAWTYFHVLIDKLELEWGPVGTVPTKRQYRRDLVQELLSAGTAPSAATRVHLTSNLFLGSNDDEMFNNHIFDVYAKKWGRGPKLPLLVKVFVRSCTDVGVLAPKALGKTQLLWDWESRSAATANTFVDKSSNYLKDKTRPKGLNCHKDRGGKRGGDTVFPKQDGYDPPTAQDGKFPFKVQPCAKPRPWAAVTECWREGVFAAKSGVLFQPARTAGDKYRVTVYSAHERNAQGKTRLLVDTDPPLPIQPALKVESGDIEIWRRIELVRYMQKSAFAPMNIGTIANFYQPAFVHIDDKKPAIEYYDAGNWNARLAPIITGWGAFVGYFIDPAVDQHAAGSQGVIFRTRAQAKISLAAQFPADFPDDLTLENWLAAQNMATDVDYNAYFTNLAVDAMRKLFNHVIHANDGLNIFQVSRSTNLIANMDATQDGEATDFPGAKPAKAGDQRTRCAFLSLADAPFYTGSAALSPEQTAAHECGHHFMLCHPPGTANEPDHQVHDSAVNDCLMTYADVARQLCGFCRLRLRGWNSKKLAVTGAANEKT